MDFKGLNCSRGNLKGVWPAIRPCLASFAVGGHLNPRELAL